MHILPTCLGLSNLKPPEPLIDSLDEQNNLASLNFIDGTPTSTFLTNIRTSAALGAQGWPSYGAAAAAVSKPGPLTRTGEQYATCTMVCTTYPPPPSQYLETVVTYYAECSSIVLPYICKEGEPTNTGNLFLSPEPGSPETWSAGEGGGHGEGRRRGLKGTGNGRPDTAHRRSRSHPTSETMLPITPEIWAQAKRLLATVSVSHPSAGAPSALLSRRALSGEGGGHGGEAALESAWPPTGTKVLTTAGNATCFPFGTVNLCTFPASVKLTQPDWMYTCWAAGLQPLGIYTYSQLYMFTWGSSVFGLPVGAIGNVFTQV